MRTAGNNPADPIAAGLVRSLRLLNILEWLHRILTLVLIIAGILLLRSAIELYEEPRPSTATWLMLEVIGIGLHFVATAFLNLIRQELDIYIAQLRQQIG